MGNKLITSYAGFPSFFNAPIVEPEKVEEGMTVVAGVPIDHGVVVGRPGARYGPRGIREASVLSRGAYEVSAENTLLDVESGVFMKPRADSGLADVGDFHVNPTSVSETTATVIEGVSNIVRRGGFPVILGGDHYVAYPGFAGFAAGMAERKPDLRLGYLHIDSHPDLRDVHGVGGRFTHGTQVRRISEERYVTFRNMAWIGLNGSVVDPAQYRIFKSEGAKVITARAVQERGPEDVVRDALDHIAQGVDAVYVSVDIDVVDGSHSPGTGAFVFSGITAPEFLGMMEALATHDVVGAIDMCEVAPPLDSTGRTAQLAASGLLAALNRRLFDEVEVDGSTHGDL